MRSEQPGCRSMRGAMRSETQPFTCRNAALALEQVRGSEIWQHHLEENHRIDEEYREHTWTTIVVSTGVHERVEKKEVGGRRVCLLAAEAVHRPKGVSLYVRHTPAVFLACEQQTRQHRCPLYTIAYTQNGFKQYGKPNQPSYKRCQRAGAATPSSFVSDHITTSPSQYHCFCLITPPSTLETVSVSEIYVPEPDRVATRNLVRSGHSTNRRPSSLATTSELPSLATTSELPSLATTSELPSLATTSQTLVLA